MPMTSPNQRDASTVSSDADRADHGLRTGMLPSMDELRVSNAMGICFTAWVSGFTTIAIWLSFGVTWWVWLLGQILLAVALLQWFVILHEAGHRTMFRSVVANRVVGFIAGFLAIIPFPCWKLVHARHHRWTGWQDLDTTTESLVPRRLRWWERWVVNVAWLTGFPLFSVLYRWGNYWNYMRLKAFFPSERHRRTLAIGILAYATGYVIFGIVLGFTLGFATIASVFCLPVFLTLMVQDPLILSQHTHIPMRLAREAIAVRPVPPNEQGEYTRSLVFPKWFSFCLLLNLDAHELHHRYPRIPGYRLHRLPQPSENSIAWWRWLWMAKRVPADVLLFQNRELTGYRF